MTELELIEEEGHSKEQSKESNPDREDLWQWANELLRKELCGKNIINSSDCKVVFSDENLHCYGDILGNRSSSSVTFEMRLVLHYTGRVFLGEACVGQLIGYINVPKVTHEGLEEEWEVQVKPFECGPQVDLVRDLCQAEQSILHTMQSSAAAFRLQVGAVLRRMLDYYNPPASQPASTPGPAAVASSSSARQVQAEAALREQCKPDKYKQFLCEVVEGRGEAMTEVDLTFCSLTDQDFQPVLQALASCPNVISIDLQYNELTDVSIQMLIAPMASGSMPILKTLRLGNNKFGEVGDTVLTGLRMLRKEITVLT
mmetsp:Transcript_11432/g.15588  ORF Transcript_11432/g.15588 Transcript_11432/m.15588 type:complete len:314 (-) Transcript_11432:162-1103(-)|eukprot:CAMPEP_0196576186 /NCGR_PEP_ID=MMETSP1081-20130531/5514_1 /TAXON_ID=36882 /ORGANISM="Pyramimonas amylifera, Strain CCMP720" /LENGTH=313 /DNA_ID=CAMNT_0041894729 /DNA_START=114 /DNA_END=1055 /DNA_ORIENTATION=-